jgi:2-polyprenyl-3-methyl-5-hydroxy-6-metoxy-1,4-benzoquinol methylase
LTELRRRLLDSYSQNQAQLASAAHYVDPEALWPHFDVNYAPLITGVPTTARILEIGGGPGQFLTWMRARGYGNLTGVEANPGDVSIANQALGEGVMRQGDGFAFAREHAGTFDVVVLKAVLEHMPKADLLACVEACAAALDAGGRVIVEVPNMDWLLAAHERYMDLTHEVGFTAGSLASLLNLCFADVHVELSRIANPTRSQRIARPALIKLIGRLLYVVGEGAHEVAYASRSLIGVARQPCLG